jgi:hypothetical protein
MSCLVVAATSVLLPGIFLKRKKKKKKQNTLKGVFPHVFVCCHLPTYVALKPSLPLLIH